MNKLLIVLLAVCLVSVHGFVKRDAPEAATEKNVVNDILNTLADIGKKISEEANKALNSDELKKNTNAAFNEASKALEELKKNLAAAGGAKE